MEGSGGQALGEGVVDLPRKPVALFDRPEPGPPVGEPGALDGDAQEVADGVEELQVR